MKRKKALDVIHDFEEDFYAKLRSYDMGTLCELLEVDLKSTQDLNELIRRIKVCSFADLMYYKPFQKFPVLAYFEADESCFFAIEQTGTSYCQYADREYPVYRSIQLTEQAYGITEVMGCEECQKKDNPFKTISDVTAYMEENTPLPYVSGIL